MSSVRARIERQERDEIEKRLLDARPAPTTVPQEVAVKPSGFTTVNNGAIMRVRDRQDRITTQARDAADVAPTTAAAVAADLGLAEHKRFEAERAAQEAADIAAGRLVIMDGDYHEREFYRKQREKQAEEEKRKADEQAKQTAFVLNLMYTSENATPRERQIVEGIVRRQSPAEVGNPDTHRAILWKLRAEVKGL